MNPFYDTLGDGPTDAPTNAPTDDPNPGETTSPGENPTTPDYTPDPDLKYDYGDVLDKTIQFMEAQRAGYLPANNRISYRKDSATEDGQDNGIDLTGGLYDGRYFDEQGLVRMPVALQMQ